MNEANKAAESERGGLARHRLVAVLDGFGENATIGLYVEDEDHNVVEEIAWPEDWPQYVTADFVKSKGFAIEVA